MARKRTAGTREYDPQKVASIAPPPLVRPRAESSIPAEVLSAMGDAMANGNWATNGLAYPDKEAAQADAAKFKRALVRIVGAKSEKELATRTWETGDGFVFAVGKRAAAAAA